MAVLGAIRLVVSLMQDTLENIQLSLHPSELTDDAIIQIQDMLINQSII